MAEVTRITNQFKYDFDFSNASGSTATRSFTIDTRNFEGGLSSAQELQQFFAGQGSLSVAAIVPNQFIQPAGWRDNNPAEPPWTTNTVYLTGITKYETSYEPAGGGSVEPSARNLVVTGADDAQDPEVQFRYDNMSDTIKPTVNVFYNGNWNSLTPTYVAEQGYYYIDKSSVMSGAKATVFVPAVGTYPADFKEFTIAY